MNAKISVLILAAGASTRMKATKQLLPWGNSTLIEHSINTATATTVVSITAVLGANREKIQPVIEAKNVHIVENIQWELGMGSSIAVGLRAILDREKPDALLVLLCDQPLIDVSYLKKMIAMFNELSCGIIATGHNGKAGVPALFKSTYFPELLELKGNKGASRLIARNTTDCIVLDAGGKQVDIDTEEDYSRFKKLLG